MMVGRLLFILCSSWAVAASAQGNTCGTLGSLTFSVPSGYIYFPMERVGDVWAKSQLNEPHERQDTVPPLR
jgi:hypothetical protein